MDKLDRQMLVMLERNPRATYRQLAEQLHLSIPALQRRLTILESTKRILGYRTLVNLEAMNGVRSMVYGQMAGKVDSETLSKIEKQGSIHTTSLGSLNSIYLMAHLQRFLELDDVIRVAQEVCRISDPQIIIFGCGSIISTCPPVIEDIRGGDISSLSEVDLKIIRSLHYNARKPIITVAKEIDLSPKTVRKRLARMISNNLIEFRTMSTLEGLGTLVFFVIVKLKKAGSRPSILKKIRDDPQFYVDSSVVVSNARDLLFFEMQTESVIEMSRIVEDIRALKEVDSVSSDLIQKVYYFDIWRDRMIEDPKQKGKGKGN
ncbi:MAG TPA: AsnC family transcriptional regulator [Methanomassiliicoccales archaeon]